MSDRPEMERTRDLALPDLGERFVALGMAIDVAIQAHGTDLSAVDIAAALTGVMAAVLYGEPPPLRQQICDYLPTAMAELIDHLDTLHAEAEASPAGQGRRGGAECIRTGGRFRITNRDLRRCSMILAARAPAPAWSSADTRPLRRGCVSIPCRTAAIVHSISAGVARRSGPGAVVGSSGGSGSSFIPKA